MNYFETMLLNYLRGGKVKMEITGFDMDGFSQAMYRELSRRLGMIEGIILEDDTTDAEKTAAIRRLFEEDFCG